MKKAIFLVTGVVLFLSFSPLSTVSGQTAPPQTPELLSKGKNLYQERCASCHGAGGNGKTPMAKILNPPPRDFQQPVKNWTFTKGDPAKIHKVIKEGIPNTAMIKTDLPDDDVWALVYTVLEMNGDRQRSKNGVGRYGPKEVADQSMRHFWAAEMFKV